MRAATACPAGRLLQVARYRVVLRRNARARKTLTKPLKPDLGSLAYESGPAPSDGTRRSFGQRIPVNMLLRAPIHRLSRWFERQSLITRDLAIDWLIILFVFLGIGAKIYSVRRTVDLHREVRPRRKAEHDAYQLARQDVLTGLPNRRWFVEEFDKVSCQHNDREACAVFVVDLDNFKPINDVYGHRLGDEVLRVIAKRLNRLAKGSALTGNIGAMTEHLLKQALSDAKTWPDRFFVSIDFSPRQISDPRLATTILGVLAKSSFPPHRLVVEITESAVVQRLHDAKAVLRSLRNVGVRIALDDFGTGYSGLYHLRELDLDIIKIDRSFVTKMLDTPEEARIVKAIVCLSRALGLHTTAEGIETTQVLDRLTKLGCDTG
jgi:diguanylate cyclase (GGDEF)-like protein